MVGLRLVREEGWRSVRGGRWWYNGPSLSPGQTQRGVKSKRRQQTLLSLKYLSIRYALGCTLPVCAPHCLYWGKGQFWDHPWFADPTPHILHTCTHTHTCTYTLQLLTQSISFLTTLQFRSFEELTSVFIK